MQGLHTQPPPHTLVNGSMKVLRMVSKEWIEHPQFQEILLAYTEANPLQFEFDFIEYKFAI